MTKQEALAHWRALQEGQDPLPYMRPIPYKATGSSYGACGVRVDGTPEFVDAVLSCLKTLLAGEGITTRLELSRQTVDGKGLGKVFNKAEENAEVCYIRLHERGSEGVPLQAFCAGAKERAATKRAAPAPKAPAFRMADSDFEERRITDDNKSTALLRRVMAGHPAKVTIDELKNMTDLPAGHISAALTELEMAGQVKSYPGGYYAPG